MGSQISTTVGVLESKGVGVVETGVIVMTGVADIAIVGEVRVKEGVAEEVGVRAREIVTVGVIAREVGEPRLVGTVGFVTGAVTVGREVSVDSKVLAGGAVSVGCVAITPARVVGVGG